MGRNRASTLCSCTDRISCVGNVSIWRTILVFHFAGSSAYNSFSYGKHNPCSDVSLSACLLGFLCVCLPHWPLACLPISVCLLVFFCLLSSLSSIVKAEAKSELQAQNYQLDIELDANWKTRILRQIHTADRVGMVWAESRASTLYSSIVYRHDDLLPILFVIQIYLYLYSTNI